MFGVMPGSRARARLARLAMPPMVASGAFPVQPSHNNARIDLTGAFYTVSGGPAGGYPIAFNVTLVNTSSSRGKLISFTGLTSFILWPLQTATIYRNNAGAWVAARPPRFVNSAGLSILVDPVNGSDTNNDGLGTTTGSMLTIPGAFSLALKNFDQQGGSVGIQLANGTHSSGLPYTVAGGFSGEFLVALGGASGQGANVILNGSISIKDYAAVSFSELTFNSSVAGSCISVDQDGICDIASTVSFGNGGAAASMSGIEAVHGGVANFTGFTANCTSMNIMFYAHSQGRVATQGATVTIPNAIAFGTACAYCDIAGTVDTPSITFSGAGAATCTGTRYTTQRGGGIWTGGGGANYFPGNAAGTATAPGWYG